MADAAVACYANQIRAMLIRITIEGNRLERRRKPDQLALHEEFMLLCLHDEKGTIELRSILLATKFGLRE